MSKAIAAALALVSPLVIFTMIGSFAYLELYWPWEWEPAFRGYALFVGLFLAPLAASHPRFKEPK